jgi:2-C-methyl-D-erythritol 4-phosphate cytidylyltransferase
MLNKIAFLVPCAGNGSRMGSSLPKQYIQHKEKPILWYTLQALSKFNADIFIITSPNDGYIDKLNLQAYYSNLYIYKVGGNTRANTVNNGLLEIQQQKKKKYEWILVHDAARPLVQHHDIHNLITGVITGILGNDNLCGGILASPIVDSLKHCHKNINTIEKSIDRDNIYAAQTPQMFKFDELQQALKLCINNNINVTDESSAISAVYPDKHIGLFASSKFNVKITYAEDLKFLQLIWPL